jgi:hypothetical protein
MTDFAVRLRRVRLKGGADVHVLHNKQPDPGNENWRGSLVRNARNIAGFASDDLPLAGYVVVGLFADGSASVAYRYDTTQSNSVPRSLIPAWIAEIIRREMITCVEARDTFNDMFEWRG